MPKFRVNATMYTDLYVIIEAENANAAETLASELCGSAFTEYPNSGDFTIGDIEPHLEEVAS